MHFGIMCPSLLKSNKHLNDFSKTWMNFATNFKKDPFNFAVAESVSPICIEIVLTKTMIIYNPKKKNKEDKLKTQPYPFFTMFFLNNK